MYSFGILASVHFDFEVEHAHFGHPGRAHLSVALTPAALGVGGLGSRRSDPLGRSELLITTGSLTVNHRPI